MSSLNIRNDSVLEFTNLRLEGISAVKENYFVSPIRYQLVNSFWLQVLTSVDDSSFSYLDGIRSIKGDQLITNTDLELREVTAGTHRPLEVDLFEAGVLLGGLHILLQGRHVSTKGSVDAVLRDENATFEPKALAEVLLPQLYGLWIRDRGEAVVKDDFL